MRTARRALRERGFTLVELMVAVIVICVGMLGIAKMQALSLSNSTTSRLRALAAIEAASLASAMHSNRQYWGNTAPATASVNSAGVASTDAAMAAAANADLATNPVTVCFGTLNSGAKCNSVALAAFDLARWSNSLTALLPNPTANIACPPIAGGAAPTSCTIQISWTEKAVAMTQQELAAAANAQFQLPTYTLYVEP